MREGKIGLPLLLTLTVLGTCTVLAGLVFLSYYRAGAFSKADSESADKALDTDAIAGAVPPVLSEEEARYLQDVEHFGGFVLGDLAFPKMAAALKKGDAGSLLGFLSPDFRGTLFREGIGVEARYPFGKFRIRLEEDGPVIALDREGFVEGMLHHRNEFESLTLAKMKVIRMNPDEHGDLDGGWNGTGKFIFAGNGADGGVRKHVLWFRCSITGISEGTPDEGGWLRSLEVESSEIGTADDFLMEDITATTGLPVARLCDNWKAAGEGSIPYLTGGVYACDFNRDGNIDLLLTDLCDGLSLHLGNGRGGFMEVPGRAGLPEQAKIAAFADLDGDGYEDLLLGPRLFRNESGKKFRELGPGEHQLPIDPTLAGYAVADYDGDGRIDIYGVGGYPKDAVPKTKWIGKNYVSRNQLLRNLGDWRFEDVTDSAKVAGNGSPTFGAVWFDANGDNLPDIMTACYGENDYYLNRGDGTFEPGTTPGGYGGFSMGISVGDIDNDGYGDPYFGNMYSKAGERVVGNLRDGLYPPEVDELMRDFVSGNDLFRNKGDGTYERIGVSSGINDIGWAYGVGYGDLNGDGLLDTCSPVGFQSVSPNKPDG